MLSQRLINPLHCVFHMIPHIEEIANSLCEPRTENFDVEVTPEQLLFTIINMRGKDRDFEVFALESQGDMISASYAALIKDARKTFRGYREIREGSRLLQQWRDEFSVRFDNQLAYLPVKDYTGLVNLSSHDISFDRAMDAAHAFHNIFRDKMQAQAASGREEYPLLV